MADENEIGFNGCKVNGRIIDAYNGTKPAFGGKSVRISVCLTEAVLSQKSGMGNVLACIGAAANTLRAHTLDLHWDGLLPTIAHNGEVSFTSRNREDDAAPLRDLITTQQENHLVVIFTHIAGDTSGITILSQKWLPFVLIDSRSDYMTLAHELGHACRCAHVKNSIMEGCSVYSGYTNFHNIHAYEIYKSYWCTGPRPQNWWDKGHINLNSWNNGPYLWPPFDRPL